MSKKKEVKKKMTDNCHCNHEWSVSSWPLPLFLEALLQKKAAQGSTSLPGIVPSPFTLEEGWISYCRFCCRHGIT